MSWVPVKRLIAMFSIAVLFVLGSTVSAGADDLNDAKEGGEGYQIEMGAELEEIVSQDFYSCVPGTSWTRNGGTVTAFGDAVCAFSGEGSVSVQVILYVNGHNAGGTLAECEIGNGVDCDGTQYRLSVSSGQAVCSRALIAWDHPSDGFTQRSAYSGSQCPTIP